MSRDAYGWDGAAFDRWLTTPPEDYDDQIGPYGQYDPDDQFCDMHNLPIVGRLGCDVCYEENAADDRNHEGL